MKFRPSSKHSQFPNYRERCTVKQWREALLAGHDKIVYKTDVMSLEARPLGYGVVELSKPKEYKE